MSAVAIVAELLAHGVELYEDHGRITTNVDFDTLSPHFKCEVLNHHVSLVMWLGEGVVLA
jgi:hypothetical protein